MCGAGLTGWQQPFWVPDHTLHPDLDECTFPGVCPAGVCTNTVGSFSCKDCEEGYRPSPLGRTCEGKKPPWEEHRRDTEDKHDALGGERDKGLFSPLSA